jgi:two-component system sensor histidine kinase UhpB
VSGIDGTVANAIPQAAGGGDGSLQPDMTHPQWEAAAPRSSVFRLGGQALLLGLAYYAGAQIGFALQSPTEPHSVLWLPNSILLSVLLVAPIKRWPLYLVAALPAQLLVAWQTGSPMLTMSLLFVTNCADAMLGAVMVRYFSDDPLRFHGLRSMLVFVVFGATISPFLVSFADAGVSVLTGWVSDYWRAFTVRTRSNVLTHLILVPGLVTALATPAARWRAIPRWRYAEALAVLLLLLATAVFVFSGPSGSGSIPTLVYVPLPLLLWAAVRFGPGLTSGSLLLLAFVSIWNAERGQGPFSSEAPADNLVALQIFLLAISVPLLCLAAVIAERQETAVALRASYQRIQNLAGRLITAQESERARIARHLHDDVNQRLAAISIELSALRQRFAATPELLEEVSQLQGLTFSLVDQVRDLSHELHPAVLQHVGLVPALRRGCEEFGGQHGIPINLDVAEVGTLSPDAALCLYRVAQEALRNVAAHAGARRVEVSLLPVRGGVELRIADDGKGFDLEDARRRGGLGLIDIDERVRLVGGRFRIVTQPQHGTVLIARVPARA